MGGCEEANNGSGTGGDWAVAVNEKTSIKTGPHDNTIVANLRQFLMPMGTTFRAGTIQRRKTSRAGFVHFGPNQSYERKRGKGVQQITYDARRNQQTSSAVSPHLPPPSLMRRSFVSRRATVFWWWRASALGLLARRIHSYFRSGIFLNEIVQVDVPAKVPINFRTSEVTRPLNQSGQGPQVWAKPQIRYNFGTTEAEISGERIRKGRSARHLEFLSSLLEE